LLGHFSDGDPALAVNIDQARYNMVEQQIRPWEVLDGAVLGALLQVPRERFVPEAHRHLAFADLEIPLGHGESMMQPKVEARIVQELRLSPSDAVYEVGTGSGYLTALLAHLAGHVTSAEIHEDLCEAAARRLAAAGCRNATLLHGDSARGPLGDGTFDAIVLTGSTPVLPDAFLARLRPGGRLFAVVGEAPVMRATLYRRLGDGCRAERLFETALKPLVHAPAPARFSL
jgi:protein-L-isoaspartate(D-aspartate) O-methyltransferase